jgi:hypothetical protein
VLTTPRYSGHLPTLGSGRQWDPGRLLYAWGRKTYARSLQKEDSNAMEIDPLETIESAREEQKSSASESDSQRRNRLNNVVAVTIALLATFMGICKVKDDNIVQAMQQAQADKIDYWGWYQARNIRQEVLKATSDEIHALTMANPQIDREPILTIASQYNDAAKKQEEKMEPLKQQADDCQRTYDALNFRDDQFDLMDAGLAIAIAMLAITSLTGAAWLYVVALIPSVFGVIMGLAGLLGWGLHPDALAKWLGT